MNRSANRRRSLRVVPGFQKRLCLQFVGLAALALCTQFLFLAARMAYMAERVHAVPGESLAENLPRVLLEVFALSAMLILPLIFAVAVVLTQRVAGPLFGLHRYLKTVAEEGPKQPFSIRDGDKIEEIRDALNAALERTRHDAATEAIATRTEARQAS